MSLNRVTSFGSLKVLLICLGLALFLGSAGINITPSHAQEQEEGAGESLPPEDPVQTKRVYKPEVVLPDGYPQGFHGFGLLNFLKEDGAIIEDHLIMMSESATFNTPTRRDCSRFEFNEGDLVGWLTGLDGKIKSLWLLR